MATKPDFTTQGGSAYKTNIDDALDEFLTAIDSSAATSNQLTITNTSATFSGNIAIHNTPLQSWAADRPVLRFGLTGYLGSKTTDNTINFGANAYYDSVDNRWEYASTGAAAVMTISNTGTFNFATAASGTVNTALSWDTRLLIDNDGNIGVGVTPEATHADYTSLQVGGLASLVGKTAQASGSGTGLFNNVYHSGASSTSRIITGETAAYQQAGGQHYFQVAASGVADSTISWTNALIIDNSANATFSGDVSLGDNQFLYVGSGKDAYLFDNGSNTSLRKVLGGALHLENYVAGGTVRIRSDDSGGTLKEGIIVGGATPNVSLHYDGASTLSTFAGGVSVGLGANDINIWNDGTSYIDSTTSTFAMRQLINSGLIYFQSYNSVGALKTNMILGGATPNVSLYENGAVRLETKDYGIKVTGAFSNANSMYVAHEHASLPNGINVDFTAASPNNATQWFLFCQDSTATRAVIRSNGGLANYQANDANLSDERLKKDVTPLNSYWDKWKNLEFVTFKYKDQNAGTRANVGLIAQQVESVTPELVNTEGFTPDDDYMSIYTTDMYHAMGKVVQELQQRVEQLEAV